MDQVVKNTVTKATESHDTGSWVTVRKAGGRYCTGQVCAGPLDESATARQGLGLLLGPTGHVTHYAYRFVIANTPSY